MEATRSFLMTITFISCSYHTCVLWDFQPPCDIVFRKYTNLKSCYWNISCPTHWRPHVSFPSVALQACFSSAEPLDCFRNTLYYLDTCQQQWLLHNCTNLSIIDSCLIMQWMARCMSDTIFNKQKPLYKVMIRFPQNKWYGFIKIISD